MVFVTFCIGAAFVKIGEENEVLKWTDISGILIENLSIFVIMQNSSRVISLLGMVKLLLEINLLTFSL
jgi:hypothetical protein